MTAPSGKDVERVALGDSWADMATHDSSTNYPAPKFLVVSWGPAKLGSNPFAITTIARKPKGIILASSLAKVVLISMVACLLLHSVLHVLHSHYYHYCKEAQNDHISFKFNTCLLFFVLACLLLHWFRV